MSCNLQCILHNIFKSTHLFCGKGITGSQSVEGRLAKLTVKQKQGKGNALAGITLHILTEGRVNQGSVLRLRMHYVFVVVFCLFRKIPGQYISSNSPRQIFFDFSKHVTLLLPIHQCIFTAFNLKNSDCCQRVVNISPTYSRDPTFEVCYFNYLMVVFHSSSSPKSLQYLIPDQEFFYKVLSVSFANIILLMKSKQCS